MKIMMLLPLRFSLLLGGAFLWQPVAGEYPVFAYGTLRADFSAHGDRWGVAKDYNITDAAGGNASEGHSGYWVKAKLRGFRLYQKKEDSFPYAVRTGLDEDVLIGTLLISERESEGLLERTDAIEGYPSLYQRELVEVQVEELVDEVEELRGQSFLANSDDGRSGVAVAHKRSAWVYYQVCMIVLVTY